MKKITGLIVSLLFTANSFAQNFCDELHFYLEQLTVDCRNIAGRIIPAFKEYATTRVIGGMLNGQCSGNLKYSNDFIKFYSKPFSGPSAADSLFSAFKSQIASCTHSSGFVVLSQANLDEGDKIIRWGKTVAHETQTLALDLKPGNEGGFIVTLELIRSYL